MINSGTYDVDNSDTIQSLSGSGGVELASGITLTTGDSGNDTVSGVISGAGAFKEGTGILTLADQIHILEKQLLRWNCKINRNSF